MIKIIDTFVLKDNKHYKILSQYNDWIVSKSGAEVLKRIALDNFCQKDGILNGQKEHYEINLQFREI